MASSRLARRSLKQSKNQLYASIIAIAIILFVTLNFGPQAIGVLGGLIDTLTGKSHENTQIVSDADVQAPTLDPIPDATPSGTINISGRSYYPQGEVELFVNDSKYRTVTLSSQDFEFDNVGLTAGDNSIKIRYVNGNKKSDFSEEERISYLKEAPKLEIKSPGDHSSFTKSDQDVTVQGATDSDNSVRVNNFVAIVDGSGNFSYVVKLSEGDNRITVTATNPAGNSVSKDITVTYSP